MAKVKAKKGIVRRNLDPQVLPQGKPNEKTLAHRDRMLKKAPIYIHFGLFTV